ncbi:thiosulfate oxidation carrier protein SoxY [Sulfurimicrobium lacus]|uniref:Thiosulfate oxidation carrier protein SoxY n=1 Tax=Sulfurimicrobium lacus TaxID=2715678 RepID=A0A6F8VDH1_9PROT|nr:thiosulfate oxidation carrier protein SoxY [Sulfurimicrobium lacus]BCB27390.1 thiosulfate oxidation carrier protein SoxY [Sulfurimicrobium lacus]
MKQDRRTFLKGAGAAGAVALAVAAGLLKPGQVLAADWNKNAFEAKSVADALKDINASGPAKSADILIKSPDIAENGAVVPVEVTSKIPGTTDIAIISEQNVNPLIAEFALANGAEGFVSTRIKMAKTSNVTVIVKAGGKVYTASKEVKVTIGGCGG